MSEIGPQDGLTAHELRILELIGEGLTNRQIGERLFLAEQTVKNYVSALFTKLGMERRTQAAAYAARLHSDRLHSDRLHSDRLHSDRLHSHRLDMPEDPD
jgi:DNA-binding NarL/FixJ family response regulator